jgi:hypothetical protein
VAANSGGAAFEDCTALTTVNLPAATRIDSETFNSTGDKPLTVTLGATTPPSLGTDMFDSVSSPKSVTVIVPSGASGYGTTPANDTDDNWGNAFRGKGWDGTNYLGGLVKTNVNLTIQTQ